ncbi:hypothetical protein [Streptomyces chromofuscus]|uniref:Uncharacterized protein n=1 Tax=Streptomyces chromofuscus TaxID=42881 RepID=A0A7M2T071_STRCW|nr:hypothetical protein [Streptomyces chromofuscus]QOV41986.1 hypothetical protein IPT68_19085 [Streptomyces chromofuscus]GGS86636.1 hypothetical protein GCM10010254_03020 [Streptomyces chromofuscus]
MAHAAPAPGARPPGAPAPATRPYGEPATRPGTTRTPDIFSPRTHAIAHWAVPVGLGLVYGYWAAANLRDAGPITGWNVLFGFVAALAFVLVYAAVREAAKRLPPVGHAMAWAAFAGVAFGFLYSLTGYSVLRCAVMSAVIAAAFFVVLFYWYYTHEDTA